MAATDTDVDFCTLGMFIIGMSHLIHLPSRFYLI
jgi:hypothetical protein